MGELLGLCRYLNYMAKSSNIRPFIQKWEGGLSKNPADTAARNPAPWTYNNQNGYHTNKGVTYTTFLSLSPKLGYETSAENFFTMPAPIWDGIFKNGYWDPWELDRMRSQIIADLIADFAYMSGTSGSFNSIKKYLAGKGIQVSTRGQAVDALNTLSLGKEQQIFTELVAHREAYFKSLNQPTFLNGWLNRLNNLKEFGLQTLLKKKSL